MIHKIISKASVLALVFGVASLPAIAASPSQTSPAPLTAETTDPVVMGWMQGSPPPESKRIRQRTGDITRFPKSRWSFNHMRELIPTRNIWRGDSKVSTIPLALDSNLDQVTFRPDGSDHDINWKQFQAETFTDAMLVMHRGKIVYENYYGAAKPQLPHMLFSVTKSFTGLLAEMLIADGILDENAKVSHYVPELSNSGFGDATVRQVMDMTTGIDYTEVYTNPLSDIVRFSIALGMAPTPPGYDGPRDSYAFLQTIGKKQAHGSAFTYLTTNTQALGWIVSRAADKSFEALLQDRLWSKMGMKEDAYMQVDEIGTGFAGGGLNATLRDMGRFGELIRNDGRWNEQQIIPASVITKIHQGGDKALFEAAGYKTLPGWSYRSQWWISNDAHGSIMARGVYGQAVYVDPKAEMVIVRFASMPQASNTANDYISLPAYRAMATHLLKSSN